MSVVLNDTTVLANERGVFNTTSNQARNIRLALRTIGDGNYTLFLKGYLNTETVCSKVCKFMPPVG